MRRFGISVLASAAAMGLLLVPMLGGTAAATTLQATCPSCIPYDFNYTSGSATSVGFITASDPSNIDQNFVTGAFAESGVLDLTNYFKVTDSNDDLAISPTFFNLPTDDNLYIVYNFQGTLNLTTGQITFTPSTAQLGLYYGTGAQVSGDTYSAGSSDTLLATFSLVSGGAGSSGLGNAAGTISGEVINAVQASGADNLFTDLNMNDLFNGVSALALQYTTAYASVGPFTTCTSGEIDGVVGECAAAHSNAQLYLAVPEPGSLGLLGGALIFFGAWTWRRRRQNRPNMIA